MRIVEVSGVSLPMARAFYYPWKEGVPKRLQGTISDILSNYNLSEEIPIMKDLVIKRGGAFSGILTGESGSGKSYALRYLLECYYRVPGAKVILIDPKKSDGARWARTSRG